MKYLTIILLFFLEIGLVNAQSTTISGTIFIDLDSNCVMSANEQLVPDIVVEARDTNTNQTYYGISSYAQLGDFTIDVPTGAAYIVSASLPYDHPYASFCQNSRSIIVGLFPMDSVDFAIQPTSFVPLMKIGIDAIDLPDCGVAKYYMCYDNVGLNVAPLNTSIELELKDSSMELISASHPFNRLSRGKYEFNINTPFLIRDTVNMIVLDIDIDCASSFPRQTHCVKASIRPQPVNVNYNGPIADIDVECLGDSVQFLVSNRGRGTGAVTRSLIVIEDDVMYTQPFLQQLDSLNIDTIKIPITEGKTYYMETKQFAGVPNLLADPLEWSAVEGCQTTSAPFNTSSLRQYYTEDARPHVAYSCQNAGDTSTYNNIRTQLKGYGTSHFINPNTPIEYRIRYINNSNNMLRGVEIRDYLSEFLDINTLLTDATNMLEYDLQIENGRELIINLPNQILYPGEKGFISFNLQQTLNNPIGTVIENQATIILGGTDTTQTAVVFHTIAENFIQLLSQKSIGKKDYVVKVFPNPAQTHANFIIENAPFKQFVLEIYNMQGQLINRVETVAPKQLHLTRNQLPAGTYAYRILGDGQAINSGKLTLY